MMFDFVYAIRCTSKCNAKPRACPFESHTLTCNDRNPSPRRRQLHDSSIAKLTRETKPSPIVYYTLYASRPTTQLGLQSANSHTRSRMLSNMSSPTNCCVSEREKGARANFIALMWCRLELPLR